MSHLSQAQLWVGAGGSIPESSSEEILMWGFPRCLGQAGKAHTRAVPSSGSEGETDESSRTLSAPEELDPGHTASAGEARDHTFLQKGNLRFHKIHPGLF